MGLGLVGKMAVIAGGSIGIGRAVAFRLAEEGAGAAICARTEETLLRTTRGGPRARRVLPITRIIR